MLFDESSRHARDPVFRKIKEEFPNCKKWIEEKLPKHESLLEKRFRKNIQLSFSSFFAELYVICTLVDRCGLVLSKPKSPAHLDIYIANKDIRIEVTAASNGESQKNSIPPLKVGKSGFVISGISQDEMNAGISFLPASNDKAKHRLKQVAKDKFEDIRKKIKDDQIPELTNHTAFIVAIYAGCLNLTALDYSREHAMLVWLLGESSINSNDEGEFLKNENSHISGVIYCQKSPMFINETDIGDSDLGSDFIFIHNPNADVPIDHSFFKCGKEVIVKIDDEGNIQKTTISHEPTLEVDELRLD